MSRLTFNNNLATNNGNLVLGFTDADGKVFNLECDFVNLVPAIAGIVNTQLVKFLTENSDVHFTLTEEN